MTSPQAGLKPNTGPLAGVRVIDLSINVLGPLATMVLGDMGADVTKVETPDGDPNRQNGPGRNANMAAMHLNMNRNKRSITLNLKSEAGRGVLLRLARHADILIENYRPGAMKRLGLGYEEIRQVNPRLVYTSISGFGQTGPWSDRPGFDLMAQAMSGVMSVTGYPGGPPVKAGVPVADIGCALFAIYATLAAYIGAKSSGQGQYVDAALFDAALAFSVWDICDYWGTGKPPEPLGTSNKMTAPYQAMAASTATS
jgi:crotonobetainyl-CoA:carnitine CoA-transferase CaiB-like acyl-CoA transferase